MPFTLSHAVVALPFVRTPLVPAAVAVGAMTPDLPLFIGRISISYGVTHAWIWLPTTALIAAALLLVWRCVLRPATRELSPGWLARRLPSEWDNGAAFALRETFPSFRGCLWLAAALTLGVASHILWDSFTHIGRAGLAWIPALMEDWGPLPGYKWLQYVSGAIALAVIALWAARWLRRRTVTAPAARVLPAAVRWAWWLSLPTVLVAAWIGGWVVWGPFTSGFTPAHLGYRVLPQATAVWGILSLVLAAAIQLLRTMRRRGAV